MNTYRVCYRKNGGGKIHRYDVDAAMPGIAVNRALKNLEGAAESIDISVRLLAADVVVDYAQRKVRSV